MGLTTILPNASVANGWTITGAATIHAATSDSSDASYISNPITDATGVVVDFTTVTLPTPHVDKVRVVMRTGPGANYTAADRYPALVRITDPVGFQDIFFPSSFFNFDTLQTTQAGFYYIATRSDGAGWTQADIDGLKITVRSSGRVADVARIYEFVVEVIYPDAPIVPTAIQPSAGSTQYTDLPTLGATFSTSGSGGSSQAAVRGEWLLAVDAGFTTNVKTILEPSADQTIGIAAHSENVPTASQLKQGAGVPQVWYIKARALDQYGTYSGYSSAQTFTVTHAPSTVSQSPTGNQYLDYGGAGSVTFSWVFSDSSPVDYQTAYQIIVERNDTSALVLDTGKVVSAVSTSTQTIPGAQKDQPLRWKIRVWDRDDVVSVAYSSNQLFRIGDKPTVAITAPTNGGTATTPSPTIVWTFAAGGGRTQSQYRLVYTKAGLTVLDTGYISGSVLTYTPVSALYNNLDAGSVTLYVLDSGGLVNSTSVNFTVSFTTPSSVAFLVDTSPYDSLGYNEVEWSRNYMGSAMSGAEGLATGAYTGTDWTGYGTISAFTVVTTPVDTGTQAIQVTKSTSTGDAGMQGLNTVFAVTPGKTYTFSSRIRPSAAARNGQVSISWRDAALNVISTSVGTSTALSNSAFTIVSVTAAAPAGAVYALLVTAVLSMAVAETAVFDTNLFGRGTLGQVLSADSSFAAWRVYRKKSTDATWSLIATDLNAAGPAVNLLSGSTNFAVLGSAIYKDYLCPANTLMQYAVVQAANRFGSITESRLPINLTTLATEQDFETGLGSWSGNGTLYADTFRSYYGTTSLRQTATAATNYSTYPSTLVPVVAGVPVTMSVLVYLGTANAGTTNMRSTFYWFSAGPTGNGTSSPATVGVAVVGQWAVLTFTATPPASTVWLRAQVEWTAASAGEYINIDDYWVTEATLAGSPHYVTSVGTNYWLIYTLDATKNVLLNMVTADDYSEEYEQSDLQLIGRGRKADVGSRWGYKGSLTALLWDDPVNVLNTARTQKLALEALRALKSTIYLRNPFGDVWATTPEDISVSRLAGVATREYGTATIPYAEIS